MNYEIAHLSPRCCTICGLVAMALLLTNVSCESDFEPSDAQRKTFITFADCDRFGISTKEWEAEEKWKKSKFLGSTSVIYSATLKRRGEEIFLESAWHPRNRTPLLLKEKRPTRHKDISIVKVIARDFAGKASILATGNQAGFGYRADLVMVDTEDATFYSHIVSQFSNYFENTKVMFPLIEEKLRLAGNQ